eukprot:5635589-Amphidinium_carterae.1
MSFMGKWFSHELQMCHWCRSRPSTGRCAPCLSKFEDLANQSVFNNNRIKFSVVPNFADLLPGQECRTEVVCAQDDGPTLQIFLGNGGPTIQQQWAWFWRAACSPVYRQMEKHYGFSCAPAHQTQALSPCHCAIPSIMLSKSDFISFDIHRLTKDVQPDIILLGQHKWLKVGATPCKDNTVAWGTPNCRWDAATPTLRAKL